MNRVLECLPIALGKAFEVAFWLVLLLVMAGVLRLVVSVTISLSKDENCPLCKVGVLRFDRRWHSQLLIEGRRTCESWTDHECENCGAQLREHRGEWEGIEGNLPRYLVDLLRYDHVEENYAAFSKAKMLTLSSSGDSEV